MQTIIRILLGNSWKTSVLGALGAVLQLVIAQSSSGQIDWKVIGSALLTYLFGRATKDAGITGGWIPQTQESKARTDDSALKPTIAP